MGIVKKNKWFIAIKKRLEDIFDLTGLTVIEPPEDMYMADPFLWEDLLFYELYDYNKGVIAYSKINDDLTLSEPVVCLQEPFHLSFPAVYREGDEILMTPETGLSGELRVYRAVEFPDKWELKEVITGGNFADPINHKGCIYTTEADNNLQIFRGKDKIVHEEYQHARSAGNMFELNSKTIRPVQDCIGQYGRAVVFYEMDGFKQKKIIHRIEPDWFPNLTGTHTFNFNDKYVVIDGRIKLETNLDPN